MAINLDNTTITLDFGYTDDNVDYKIRFHHTEELGDTISLSENGSDYLSYPATMIMDVGLFLKEQKLIKNKVDEAETPEKVKKTNKPSAKISNLLNPKKVTDEEEGVSGFGGLSAPKIEGEVETLLDDQDEDEGAESDEENVIIKKFAENIEELTEPEIRASDGLTKDDVEAQWQKRDNKPEVGSSEASVKRS